MKTALYPGTFDPLTNGHVSLTHRALDVFDHVIIGIAADTPKTPLFSLSERLDLAQKVFSGDRRVSIETFTGLTVEYAADMKVAAIVRGLRAVSDFEYEFQLALMNRRLAKHIQTVFLMTDYRWLYISSTIIKGAAAEGGDITGLVPDVVLAALAQKFPPLAQTLAKRQSKHGH